MEYENSRQRARWAQWWIERNPSYLLSGACIAIGARLYLVEPRTRAGDIGVILLTLGFLQAYEWAVATILLWLHHRRRSPEDQPSLLLVSALFWTGPLAATAEMTAHRPQSGLLLALAACLVAIAELNIIQKRMQLRFSVSGRLAACACVLLLAIGPRMLVVPKDMNGSNEIMLYAIWWLLPIILLLSSGAVREHVPGRPYSSRPSRTWAIANKHIRPQVFPIPAVYTFDDPRDAYRGKLRNLQIEVAFLLLVFAATIAHLVGMNYAFFAHARWFYASPLITVTAAVLWSVLTRLQKPGNALVLSIGLLPLIALLLALEPFDPYVPVKAFPDWLQDPLSVNLFVAAAVWWYGYRRTGQSPLLHAGNAALAWGAYRQSFMATPSSPPAAHSITPTGEPSRDLIVICLYGAAAYLLLIALLRRSRFEVLAALVVHQTALTIAIWDETAIATITIALSAGWSWLASLHLLGRRPCLKTALWPIGFLLAITWLCDLNGQLASTARVHALGMVLVLLLIGQAWPQTRYRSVAAGLTIANAFFYTSRHLAEIDNPTAAFVSIAGFVLLCGGALISHYKPALLEANGIDRQTKGAPSTG